MNQLPVNIYEFLGQLTQIELSLEELHTDQIRKENDLKLIQKVRMLLLQQHEMLVHNTQLDMSASVMAQIGLEDVVIPTCIDNTKVRQGIVCALSCQGLRKRNGELHLGKWNERQLGYFIEQIHPFEKGTMPNNELSAFFHVPNLSKAISAYYENTKLDRKPQGYEAIDRIVKAIA